MANDELSLQEFKAFTQLDDLVCQDAELQVEEEDDYLPLHQANRKTRFEGLAGERQKQLLLQAWDQLESKEDQDIKDFVHTIIFPAVLMKAKTWLDHQHAPLQLNRRRN